LEVGWLSLAKVTRRIFGLCAELSTFWKITSIDNKNTSNGKAFFSPGCLAKIVILYDLKALARLVKIF